MTEITEGEYFEKVFTKMMDKGKFWFQILSLFRTNSKEIEKHPKVRLAEDSVLKTIEVIQDKTISCQYLIYLKTKETEVKRVLSTVVDVKSIEMAWDSCKQTLSNYQKNLKLVGEIFKQMKGHHIWELRSLIKEVLEYVAKKTNDLSKGSLTVDEFYMSTSDFSIIEEVAICCKNIQQAIQSKIFWNIVSNFFQNASEKQVPVTAEKQVPIADEKQVLVKDQKQVPIADPDAYDEISLPVLFGYVKADFNFEQIDKLKNVMKVVSLLGEDCLKRYQEIWLDCRDGRDQKIIELHKIIDGIENMETEIDMGEKITNVHLQKTSRCSLVCFSNIRQYTETVQTIKAATLAFNFCNQEGSKYFDTIKKFENILNGDLEDVTLNEISPLLDEIQSIHAVIKDETREILQTLENSTSLLDFLRELIDEDIRNLIDAVEEHSEQYVRESTVSDLIEVKRFFQPILKGDFQIDISGLFEKLQSQTIETGIQNVAEKIVVCRDNLHSLIALYKNVANRGERTVEVIDNIVKKGIIMFSLHQKNCIVSVKYEQNGKKHKHSNADLSDLRSRALLLMNAEEKDRTKKSTRKEQLQIFVNLVDQSFEIAHLCMRLKESGHFEFSSYDKICKKDDMLLLINRLQNQFDSWMSEINECRNRHYYMNFLYSNQLYELYRYLHGDAKNEDIVAAILKFINPVTKSLEDMAKIYRTLPTLDNQKDILGNIGKTLDFLFSDLTSPSKISVTTSGNIKMVDKVQPGKPYMTSLEEDSPLIIRTLLALYINTTNTFPEAHQLLFCRKDTTFDEIKLLLQRCILKGDEGPKALFAIANIEKLQGDVQFLLHDEIRKLPPGKYLLCFLCRGHSNHPFLDQFSDLLQKPPPMSELKLKQYFKEYWSHISVVTSEVPGLGKSEYIQSSAIKNKTRSACIHISGPMNRLLIIEELMKLCIKPYHVLHVDIGTIHDPYELDLFLFELIVLRHVSVGSTAYALECEKIFIEIANTVKDTLRNSLPVVTCFQRKRIEWDNYNDLKISSEINSPVQVVCQYLKAMDTATLDVKDLYFTGQNKLAPLPYTECRSLLRLHFSASGDMSYTLVNIFIRVLADQLKKLSASVFFRASTLNAMLGDKQSSVKSDLVTALINTSREFAARSVHTCRSTQAATIVDVGSKDISEVLAERVAGMIRWEDSNHLVILFHQNFQTVSALYRNVNDVPKPIDYLFKKQGSTLVDFNKKSTLELEEILLLLTRRFSTTISKNQLCVLRHEYALTPDNLLKMILISLRVNTRLPILIMGETGCGKTSLIRYLANICGVAFEVFSIHAGTDEHLIKERIKEASHNARKLTKNQYWLFLDEINTCDHLGLITSAICHRFCQGIQMPPNLILLAACNPYRLRKTDAIMTAGLQGLKIKTDELSRLVYRVHPLPETLIDYVWDYGSLSKSDEKSYIFKMISSLFQTSWFTELFACLLDMSQKFVRSAEINEYCVSLRDVDRCRRLVKWFNEFLEKKDSCQYSCIDEDIRIRNMKAIILGLAVCYHSRFPIGSVRCTYRKAISDIVLSNGFKFSEADILNIVLKEQEDILHRMTDLPEGTALNTALQENVFMLLVCILSKIPIFLVGKPGCSKSLSMQLIRSNLRGKDSTDVLFKDMPQLFCVSFQGSESSTSDGIIKVFEKAEKYQLHNDEKDVLSVVILDEIGLAEISRFNPLKVLHGLIEPANGKDLNIAVVGISNWALDAAKMNRAIHLSRPDMDLQELKYTGKSISSSIMKKKKQMKVGNINLQSHDKKHSLWEEKLNKLLEGLAEGYHEYCSKEKRYQHFHGLRDFYSLIKYVGRKIDDIGRCDDDDLSEIILTGILRNFGGLPTEQQYIINTFQKYIPEIKPQHIPVMKLISENMNDKACRHLMLITNGDTVISVLERELTSMNLPFEIIFGSSFEEDLSDDYNYRILSRIILCMEQGMVLILKDLESIYGSLYDMLNQNYTIVGKKKNCRVALGHYSNPMCHVHDSFKCIVLVEETKLDYSDPPFLNRFEKQQFKFSDLLENDTFQKVVDEISNNVSDLCLIPHHEFSPSDIIPLFSRDFLVSLVVHCKQITSSDIATDEILRTSAFKSLLWLIPPEVIIRGTDSVFAEKHPFLFSDSTNKFLSLPLHDGIEQYFENTNFPSQNSSLSCIFTYSSIHSNIPNKFESKRIQRDKLAVFKSEKQFSSRVENFYHSSDDLLILQCLYSSDWQHILLAKVIIEKYLRELKRQKDAPETIEKKVCIVVHLERFVSCDVPLNFLSGWNLLFLDTIAKPETNLQHFYNKTKLQIVKSKDLKNFINESLFWALSRIQFTSKQNSLINLEEVLSSMHSCGFAIEVIKELIITYIQSTYLKSGNWCICVANDSQALLNSATYINALEKNIQDMIKSPLAMYLYQLMQLNLLSPVFVDDQFTTERQQVWRNFVQFDEYLNVEHIPEPTGPECYSCDTNFVIMKMPGSRMIMNLIEFRRAEFMDIVRQLRVKTEIDIDEEMPTDLFENAYSGCADIICLDAIKIIAAVNYEGCKNDFIHDFCNIQSFHLMESMAEDRRISVFQWALTNYLKIEDMADIDFKTLAGSLHATLWVYGSAISAICQMAELANNANDITWNFIDNGKEFFNVFMKQEQNNKSESMDSINECKLETKHAEIIDENQLCLGAEETIQNLNNVCHEEIKDTVVEHTLPEETNVDLTDPTSNPLNIPYIDSDVMFDEKTTDISQLEHQNNASNLDKRKFVKYVCASLIPQQNLLDIMSLHDWLFLVKRMLPLAFIVSCETEELVAVKLCQEISETLLSIDVSPTDYILKIGSIISNCDGKIDTEELWCFLFDVLSDIKCKNKANPFVLQKLFCSYIVRCLVSNSENDGPLKFVLAKVCNGDIFDNQLSHFGQILKFAVMIDVEDDEKNPYMDLLSDSSEDEDEVSFATCFDEYLTTLDFSDGKNMAFPILLSDVLEEYAVNIDAEMIRSVDSSSCELLGYLSYAFQKASEGILSIQTIMAVAFLRKFLKTYANILQSNNYDTSTVELLSAPVNSLLCITEGNTFTYLLNSELLHFILKTFEKISGQENIEYICSRIGQSIPALHAVSWNTDRVRMNHIFNPFCQFVDQNHYNHCLTQVATIKQNTNKLLDILSKPSDNTFVLLCVIAQQFYMHKCLKESTDSEHELASRLGLLFDKSNFSSDMKLVFSHLLGETQFKLNIFELSVAVMPPTPHMVSIMLHMTGAILSAGCKENIWYRLIKAPKEFTQLFIPLLDICSLNKMEDWSKVLMKIQPVSINVLQILMYSSITSCLGFGLAEEESFKDLFKMSVGVVLKSVGVTQFPKMSETKVSEIVVEQLRHYWQNLKTILQLSFGDICLLLHEILFLSQDLLIGKNKLCLSENCIEDLLTSHTRIIEKVLRNRISHLQNMRHADFSFVTDKSKSMEDCVLEIVPCDYDVDFQNAVLLFRSPASPTLDLLMIDIQLREDKSMCGLLDLVLKNINKLALPQNITPLIRWHLCVITYGSYRYRKVEFKDMTCDKFISGETDDTRRDILRKAFDDFIETWNNIKSVENIDMFGSSHTIENMELMCPTVKMGACTILDDQSVLKKVLISLCEIQNAIIYEATCSLSNSKNSETLNQPEINDKAISLLDLKRKDLITFEWQDKWLQYCQCDTSYGLAQSISFDLERIEKEIKAEVLVGKSVIHIPTIPTVMFTDDLYHNSVQLLKAIECDIDQDRLSNDVKKNIEKKKETDTALISNLLTHIGMVLSLLRKIGAKSDVTADLSIVDYLEQYKTVTGMVSGVFRNLFPEDVRLCHIVDMYRWLEEINGDIVVDSLELQYRKQLRKDDRDRLSTAQADNIKYLEKLDHTLKVFVHRSLSLKGQDIRLGQPLIDYILDEDLWWEGDLVKGQVMVGESSKPLEDIVSSQILVENIFDIIQLVRKSIEVSNIYNLTIQAYSEKWIIWTVLNSHIHTAKKVSNCP